jgi:hypothetical protein
MAFHWRDIARQTSDVYLEAVAAKTTGSLARLGDAPAATTRLKYVVRVPLAGESVAPVAFHNVGPVFR